MNMDSKILASNQKQAHFFDTAPSQRHCNFMMRLWRSVRTNLYDLMVNSGIWSDVFALHRQWMGDLSGKKVLDFGCYQGNVLTPYLATHAAQYLGIDLSHNALKRLAERFEENGIQGARLQCADVLSKDFVEKDFDIIYAQGVLHHFNPIDFILPVLREKLAAGGRIVSCDPLQTSLLARGVRAIYQPFRSDKEWEWPFSKGTFAVIKKHFRIRAIQGVVGYSKWAVPMIFLHRATALKLMRTLHDKDMRCAASEQKHLWRCLQVAMHLEKYE